MSLGELFFIEEVQKDGSENILRFFLDEKSYDTITPKKEGQNF